MRMCTKCHESKLDEGFGKARPSSGRPRTQCRDCENTAERERRKDGAFAAYLRKYRAEHRDYRRRWNLKSKYGITPEEYLRLFEQQGGICAICRRPQTKIHRDGSDWLDVDHDHLTGRVRGLLCHNCNLGIGRFGDDPEMLRAALRYLVEDIGI